MNDARISFRDGEIHVPHKVIIPYIEGDGSGADIWKATKMVIDTAVYKAYELSRAIEWKEVYAGEKAFENTGEWLPADTIKSLKKFKVAIKGPVTTPMDPDVQSANLSIRQQLDLYASVRPLKWIAGVPSPLKSPQKFDLTIFRENLEDVYAAIEGMENSSELEKVKSFVLKKMDVSGLRFSDTVEVGIKPISMEGTNRLVRSAIKYALKNKIESLTLVHNGDIMKSTEGKFKKWAYNLIKMEFPTKDYVDSSWQIISKKGHHLLIKDVFADDFLQQVMIKPEQYDLIVTTKLNGDYISTVLAGVVGGRSMVPGASINYESGIALFEAMHGTVPKHKDKDKVNPTSQILSGAMMLDYMGWKEAARLITKGVHKAIAQKTVTYDLHKQIKDATLLSCSEFARAIAINM